MIAAELTRVAGVDLPQEPTRYVLRTRLLGADRPLFLEAELDAQGRLRTSSRRPHISTDAPWWPPAKLFGRHLSPWMAARARPPLPATN